MWVMERSVKREVKSSQGILSQHSAVSYQLSAFSCQLSAPAHQNSSSSLVSRPSLAMSAAPSSRHSGSEESSAARRGAGYSCGGGAGAAGGAGHRSLAGDMVTLL